MRVIQSHNSQVSNSPSEFPHRKKTRSGLLGRSVSSVPPQNGWYSVDVKMTGRLSSNSKTRKLIHEIKDKFELSILRLLIITQSKQNFI
jgi:hypothetical protein